MQKTNRLIAKELGVKLGIDLFTLEYEILAHLHDVDVISHKDLCGALHASSATLERKLVVLLSKGLVEVRPDESDMRRRGLVLSHAARKILNQELEFFANWHVPEGEIIVALAWLVGRLRHQLGNEIFGPEYKIILNVYRNDSISTVSLFKSAGLSQASFFNKLKVLKDAGIIKAVRGERDLRLFRIVLSEWATEAIDFSHHELSKWATEMFRRNDG